MKKRNYTHVQALLPEIRAMLAAGRTQREVAGYYGFPDKKVVKGLLERERRKERKLEAGILPRPKAGREKKQYQEISWRSRPMRSSGCVWRTNCCGIFCAAQEGSETKGKISNHLSSQNRVSRGRHVQILRSIQKRLLCFRPSPG